MQSFIYQSIHWQEFKSNRLKQKRLCSKGCGLHWVQVIHSQKETLRGIQTWGRPYIRPHLPIIHRQIDGVCVFNRKIPHWQRRLLKKPHFMSRALEELDHPVFFLPQSSLLRHHIWQIGQILRWIRKKLDIHTQLIGTFSFN